VADHFQYVSIAAVIALVVAGGYQCAVRPVWLVGAGVVFGLIAWLHWGETRAWHVQEVIWAAGPMALALIPGGDERVWRWAWNGYLGVVVVCFAPMAWSLSGNYQNEGKYFTAVLEKNPNCWQAYNHLGAWLYMNGDIEGSLPMFKKATELKPENPESHNNLGLVFSYFGATEDAIGEFKTAVSIKDDSAMDTNLANAYEEAGRYPEAVAEYKHAIELSPQNASAWCNMGYALMREGKTDDAIPAFMKAIEYDPGMLQGRTDLYQALKMRGIDPDKPPGNGTFPFDLKKALELLKEHPPDPKVVHGK